MLDADLFVLRRLMSLRQFPLLAAADLGELAVLAENLVETTYRSGAVVAPAGIRPAALHLVFDGQIAMAGRMFRARSAFAVLEVLARRELRAPAVAVAETRTLQLASRDIIEMLEENFRVLRATLRELARRVLVHAPPPPVSLILPTADPLSFVDRLVVLRQQPFLRGARLDALAMIAHSTDELRFASGDVVARAGELAAATHVVLDGGLIATDPTGKTRRIGPGEAIGAIETLADAPYLETVAAQVPTRVLAAGATAMLDTLEDHTDLGLAMVAQLAGLLADRPTVERVMHEVRA